MAKKASNRPNMGEHVTSHPFANVNRRAVQAMTGQKGKLTLMAPAKNKIPSKVPGTRQYMEPAVDATKLGKKGPPTRPGRNSR